ncbi:MULTISPECIES: hypothetical protein [unclassified Bradyrhizobium]
MNYISLDRFLWREGLAAEKAGPKLHSSVGAFEKVARDRLADWADFDMVAAHYAYGYDLLCSEDTGSPRSNSIFGAAYAADVTGLFGLSR